MGFHFGAVLAFALVALVFALGGITLSRLLGPRVPSAEKATIYECGERPIGVAWFNFNPRFYLVALVFVIFEVDIGLTFPVVAVYRRWVEESPVRAWTALLELLAFTVILVVGLAWVWARGDLDWVKRLSAQTGASQAQGPAPAAAGADQAGSRPAA
ncbi:MAG TPA: NADH-quinone oxidoreductase subunit A [Anaeromyxobacter sp.]|nr:NADH-quinone oxidoreductase subunit A [Anaeromyxobacter sp.]